MDSNSILPTFVKTAIEANELPKLIPTTGRSGRDHHWSFSAAILNRLNGVYWHWWWYWSERARKEKNDWRRAEMKGKKYLLSEILGTNEPHYSLCDDFPNSSGTSECRQKIDVAKCRLKNQHWRRIVGDRVRMNGLRIRIWVTNVSVDDAAYGFDERDLGVASQLWVIAVKKQIDA